MGKFVRKPPRNPQLTLGETGCTGHPCFNNANSWKARTTTISRGDHGPLRQVSGHWNKAREQDAQAVSPWYLTSCSVPERCSTGYHIFYTAKQMPAIVPSKKSPPNKYYDKKSQSSKGAVLNLVSLNFRVV